MSEGLDLGVVISEIHEDIREIRNHLEKNYVRKEHFDFHKNFIYVFITAIGSALGIVKGH
jgi:hypothetical protein